jgi:hypothetical protein
MAGTYTVTVEQFRKFVINADYKTEAEKEGNGVEFHGPRCAPSASASTAGSTSSTTTASRCTASGAYRGRRRIDRWW